jgi:hypothetical protein
MITFVTWPEKPTRISIQEIEWSHRIYQTTIRGLLSISWEKFTSPHNCFLMKNDHVLIKMTQERIAEEKDLIARDDSNQKHR